MCIGYGHHRCRKILKVRGLNISPRKFLERLVLTDSHNFLTCTLISLYGINFGPIPHSAIDHNCRKKHWFMRTVLQVIEIRLKAKLPYHLRTKPSSSFLTCDRSHAHLIVIAHACSTIRGAASMNKYGTLYQLSSQQSKTHANVADPGSASVATFQCIKFWPFLSISSYLFYLGLQTKTKR